jgi:Uncharacterised protein family (UPF0158)
LNLVSGEADSLSDHLGPFEEDER